MYKGRIVWNACEIRDIDHDGVFFLSATRRGKKRNRIRTRERGGKVGIDQCYYCRLKVTPEAFFDSLFINLIRSQTHVRVYEIKNNTVTACADAARNEIFRSKKNRGKSYCCLF